MKNRVKKGFLLTEIMTALLMIASFGVLLARYHMATVKLQQESADYLLAATMGQEASAHIILGSRQEKRDGRVFAIETTVSDFAIPHCLVQEALKAERLSMVKHVHIEVRWKARDGKNNVFVVHSAVPFAGGAA